VFKRQTPVPLTLVSALTLPPPITLQLTVTPAIVLANLSVT